MKHPIGKLILFSLGFVIILFAANLGMMLGWFLPRTQAPSPAAAAHATDTASPVPTRAPTQRALSSPSPAPSSTLPPATALEGLRRQGVMIFSMSDGTNNHLFAYHPQYLPLTRLTDSPWDDIDPAVSPDGHQVAFASRQNGYWDIYLLDLATGRQVRVTDSPEYDGAPTWSPDGQFLAYESYTQNGIQIFIRKVNSPNEAPVQLTFGPGQSFSPAWSPRGREIAFVSTRTGQEDIWLARLDRIDDRFIDISLSGTGRDRAPRWSADGRRLAWSTDQPGTSVMMVWEVNTPERMARPAGNGDIPVWSPVGDDLLAVIREPNHTSLAVYHLQDGSLLYPPIRLPGNLAGIEWRAGPVPDHIAAFPLPANARQSAAPLYRTALTVQSGLQKNRFAIVGLKDVAAPYPYLQDSVDESFQALRKETARLAGWDFLGNLENAYVPVTTPSLPGFQENWLYTGRAFEINSVPVSAGWVVVLREDIGGQTFWRVLVRTLSQDASYGMPIRERPWDLNSRYRGDPRSYDQGGEYGAIPEGYWLDFTDLAWRYGWERLPALINWRTYYPATQFGDFVMRENLTWGDAMAQVYPGEAVATPTPWVTLTPTITPTPTLWWQRMITPSITPTATLTATRHPTLTPPTPRTP